MDSKKRLLKDQLDTVNKLSGFLQALNKFHVMFEEVYGFSYSDKDDDWLIDSIDYDGAMPWKEFKRHMKKEYGL